MLEVRSATRGGEFFTDRNEFLVRWQNAFNLCDVIERNNELLHPLPPGNGEPWITPVLGSGCLPTSAKTNADLWMQLAPTIAAQGTGESGPLARDFVDDLLDTTHRPVAGGDRKPESAWRIEPSTVRLCETLGRLRDLERKRPRNRMVESDPTYLEAAKAASIALALQLEAEQAPDSANVSHVIGVLQSQVAAASILPLARGAGVEHQSVEVRALTALARHRLGKAVAERARDLGRADQYPTWHELLLELSLERGLPRLAEQTPVAAVADARHAARKIQRALASPTNTWVDRAVETSTTDFALQQAAARVLVAQAHRRQLRPRRVVEDSATNPYLPHITQPPIASAFVTSFDLELTLALLDHPDHPPFVMAVPVYLHLSGDTAHPLWLGRLVRPHAGATRGEMFDLLTKDRDAGWFVLSNRPYFSIDILRSADHGRSEQSEDPMPLGDLPMVVHLNGCPLVPLPRTVVNGAQTALAGAVAQLLFHTDALPAGALFEHAVLLGDHDALQQTMVEVFEMHDRDPSLRMRLGLPREISGLSPQVASFARYWTILGVPIQHSQVRFRLSGHLVSPGLREGPDPRRAGVIVGAELDRDDGEVFYWHGFDVVRDDPTAFVTDLWRHAHHLEANPPLQRPREDPCQACAAFDLDPNTTGQPK